MSALGHKQTYAPQQFVSALPPIATAKADIRKWSCPLYPRKRTCAVHKLMSALGQKRTYEHLTGLVALLLSFEPLPSEQEIVERLGSWCHTLILRAKYIGVGSQYFDINSFVDALYDPRGHH